MTKTERDELRKIAAASTRVVRWYPHSDDGTVRGPFYRWFTCTGGDYPQSVAPIDADVDFAAAAMNSLIPLLDELDRMESLLHGGETPGGSGK